MSNTPLQQISPGHARFVAGFQLTKTLLNPDGTTVAVPDTDTVLIATSSNAALVQAAMDPNDNRKVILTANPNAPFGGSASSGNVSLNTSPPLPVNTNMAVPWNFTPSPDRRSLTWDPATGGIQGDA